MVSTSSMTSSGRILLVGVKAAGLSDGPACTGDMQAVWTVRSVKSGAEALGVLEKDGSEVVVAQAWLPDFNGADFLDQVMRQWPRTARILVSDAGSIETTVRGIGKAHHYLLGHFDAQVLLGLCEQIRTFRSSLVNPALSDLVAQLHQLPSPPETYFQILDEAGASDASVERIAKLIVQDPALSAKILQLANSAVFGLQLQMIHPVEAVIYLGLETTKALLLLAHTFSYFEGVDWKGFSPTALQYHAVTVARYAQQLADVETGGSHSIQTECFTAGLLHDIGKLFLAANLPERYNQVLTVSAQERKNAFEIEEQILGANHAEVAGFVLHTWNLPESIVEAVHWHHCPGKSPGASGFTALTAVHAANALEHELRTEPGGLVGGEPDWEYLKAAGFGERWPEWRLRCTSASAKKWL